MKQNQQKTEYILIAKIPGVEGDYLARKIIHRIDGTEARLPCVLDALEEFLKATGYCFSGTLGIIDASDD